jgi:hypothetical protein
MLILWPLLALPAGVFSQGYFTMWIVVSTEPAWGVGVLQACGFTTRGSPSRGSLICGLWTSVDHKESCQYVDATLGQASEASGKMFIPVMLRMWTV